MGMAWSFSETERNPTSSSAPWSIDEELILCPTITCLLPLTAAGNSETLINGLAGDDGDELNDNTEGGEVNEAGARTVNVRSSDVKFEA